MIITDGIHMVSTESEDELHEFAMRLGFKRSWYQEHPQHPHYDLTTLNACNRAIRMGAKKVTAMELLTTAWWASWPGAWKPRKPVE